MLVIPSLLSGRSRPRNMEVGGRGVGRGRGHGCNVADYADYADYTIVFEFGTLGVACEHYIILSPF